MNENEKIITNELMYWTYVSGSIVLCKVLEIYIKKGELDTKLKIQTEFGNIKNLSIDKVFLQKEDLLLYLKKNKIAFNLIQNIELEQLKR